MKKSPIDNIFEEIFGYSPKKAGTAYERIAAIATYLINGGEVTHDAKLRGQFSETLYQIDVHHQKEKSSSMGEVKDYTLQGKKVGRPDLQKLGGALPDLGKIQNGTFFSATGYTTPAKKYAEQAKNIVGKPISLYGLRPSTEFDEKGFVKEIRIKTHIILPLPENGTWLPHVTEEGQKKLLSLLKDDEDKIEIPMTVASFYNKKGEKSLTIEEITSQGYGEINENTGHSHGCFILLGHYNKIDGLLIEMRGLEYVIPYHHESKEIVITDDSKNRFVVLDQNEKPIKIITDKKLRKYDFQEDGSINPKNS